MEFLAGLIIAVAIFYAFRTPSRHPVHMVDFRLKQLGGTRDGAITQSYLTEGDSVTVYDTNGARAFARLSVRPGIGIMLEVATEEATEQQREALEVAPRRRQRQE